jgi:hypothetical protein
MFMRRRYAALLLILTFFSCGIEDYRYLPPIDSGNISMNLNTLATVNLPYVDAGAAGQFFYFRNFIIYYRIYISDISIQGKVSLAELQTLNAGLYSDYYYLNPYTTMDNNRSPSAMGSIFSSRRFYQLMVDGNVAIDNILSSGAPSPGTVKPLILDFAQQSGGTIPPSLTINSTNYDLQRYYDPAVTMPIPTDGFFINSTDLQDQANISSANRTNMDVQNKENITGQKYTYAAMYILLFGRDVGLTPIYSAPTFIGIFRLPD